MGAPDGIANGESPQLPYIDLEFDNKNVDASARALVYQIQPKWRDAPGKLEIVKFTEGITNTVSHLSFDRHVPKLMSSAVAQSRQISSRTVPS